LDDTIIFLGEKGAAASDEELNSSQQVLERLREKVESGEVNVLRQVDTQSEIENSDCLQKMSNKIKTALDVLNWLKETR